ncbi:membrane protein [Pseudidiomarina salinarum]|uniref:Membrane protein n=1 Tax=Pseudidiomarina salinarum TaxID=435908 RepID=A0A094JBW2_9GAMM|nr:efflux RND transporter periplasmic adaptor subunit [Pseudidiomarina salinarum]KFZ30076.1 membrane protein [Pseudidiomarina salinarum]RUO70046.1 efflux RND transporter periplasmic adaptor subunit [Pseudidiomarina salinarum]
MAFKKRVLLPPAIILVAILLVVVLVSMRPEPPKRETIRPAVLVEVKEVQPEDVNFLVAGQGNVEARNSTTLVAQVTGQVIDMADNFVAGGFFKKGDVLLRIDPSDYRVAVQSAKANLAQARSNLAEESARAQVAKEEWESLQMGEIPDLGLRKPQVASAVAAVQSAEAAVAKAERDLARTEIKAPFDGLLQSKNVDLGQFVSMNSQIGQIMSTNIAEVRVPLSDRDISYLELPEIGNTLGLEELPEVELYSDVAGQRHSWMGRLVRTEGVLDPASRVIYGVVEVKDPYNRAGQTHETPLRFGRFVQLNIEGVEAEQVYTLPRYALTTTGKLWVVDEDRRLSMRDVSVLRAEANTIYVDEGLQPGDKVVLTQLSNALVGMKVRLPGDPLPEENQETPASESDDSAAVGSN